MKKCYRHRIPLKVCSKISRISMDLTTWMKKCVVYVQSWIKRVSMEGNFVGFFWEKDCYGAPQWPLGFATTLNMWDLVGCLEPGNLHCYPQPLLAIGFGLLTTSILDRQAHAWSEHFEGFPSCRLMVQSDHFLCNVFHVYWI